MRGRTGRRCRRTREDALSVCDYEAARETGREASALTRCQATVSQCGLMPCNARAASLWVWVCCSVGTRIARYMFFSPGVWLDADCGKPADAERGASGARRIRSTCFPWANDCLPARSVATERQLNGNQAAYGITVTVHGGSLSAFSTHVFVHAVGRAAFRTDRIGASERCRERRLATRCHSARRTCASTARANGANQGARRELLRRAPSACWQDGG